MIILFIALFTVLTFFGFMFMKSRALQLIVGGLSLLLLASSVLMLTLHIKDNWGMKTVSQTEIHQIYTAGDTKSNFGMLINQELGTNTGNYVLVFRNNESDGKAETHFAPEQNKIDLDAINNTGTFEMTNKGSAEVVVEKKVTQFNNGFMKFLFNIGGQDNKVVSSRSTVKIPKESWIALTPDQAKQLGEKGDAAKKEGQAKLEAALKAAPNDQVRQMIQDQANQVQAQQANLSPQENIAQIKALLGIK
ncbi:MAG: DUF4811 domain-containing protein [Streptococcaceae bacterium]|nr:DUF4811 domain-containing protein [Streptococcaceae bacterium]MCL2681118.1 DUF4811 domain-containing protein [Streptococcaceae bacterium]MCL2858159.1 DUF4811 domain-containing protein [Streptococcaceae bacterium]